MCEINLTERKDKIADVATELFDEISKVPSEQRLNNQDGKAMHVFIGILGTEENICFSVYETSEGQKTFVVNKAILAELLGCNQLPSVSFGDVTFTTVYGVEIQVKVDGLKKDENIFVCLALIAFIAGVSAVSVYHSVQKIKSVKLPFSLSLTTHYLYEMFMNEHWLHYYQNEKRK